MKCCQPTNPERARYEPDPLKAPNEQFICYCREVTKGQIIEAIKKGACDLETIKKITRANTGHECKTKNPKKRCCAEDIKTLLDYYD